MPIQWVQFGSKVVGNIDLLKVQGQTDVLGPHRQEYE